MSEQETSKIYEEAVELRELLNKIPDWKERMSAQFLACIIIGNRRLGNAFSGDRRSFRDTIQILKSTDIHRIFDLIYELHEVHQFKFKSTTDRYAVRAFIMSVILGQEYANADAVALVNGLREGDR